LWVIHDRANRSCRPVDVRFAAKSDGVEGAELDFFIVLAEVQRVEVETLSTTEALLIRQ
jgi:hypothetical protein